MAKYIKRTVSLFLLFTLIAALVPIFGVNKVEAGLSETNIWETSMYESGFKMLYEKGNIENLNGNICFTENTYGDARIISKTKIYNIPDKAKECGFSAGLTIDVESYSQEENNLFGLVFGLTAYSSNIPAKNSTFVYFSKDGGQMYVGVKSYDKNLAETDIVLPVSIQDNIYAGFNDSFRFETIVDKDGGIVLKVNDNVVVNKKDAGLSFEGFIGLAQTQQNIWTVSNFLVQGSTNYIPDAKDISATFTNGGFNANELYSYAYINFLDDCYLKIVDGKLEFKNVSSAYLSTMFEYSNYNLTFDICDLQREAEFDDNFNIAKPISNKISIALYSQDYNVLNSKGVILEICPKNWSNSQTPEKTEIVLKQDTNVLAQTTLSDYFNIWDTSHNGQDVNVKVSLTDGVIELYLKYSVDSGYNRVFTYNLGNAGQGFVKIFATGTSKMMGVATDYSNSLACNFKIDNFYITNNDYSTLDVEVLYKDSRIFRSNDYDYQDTWNSEDLLFGGK